MDIKGKIYVFPKEVGKNKIKIFETTISRKEGEKYADNYTIRVQFSKELLPDEKKEAYKVGFVYGFEVEGFLSTRGYDVDGGIKHITEPLIIVNKAKGIDQGREVKQKPKEPASDALEANPDALPL